MPYDPRHWTEGGNRSTTRDDFKAPVGKYRIIMVDTFDGGDCILGDYSDRKEAIRIAGEKGGSMNKVYVYNSKGTQIYSAGTF